VSRDSSVGIAARYGLSSPGVECLWWARFSAPVLAGPGAHPASYTMGTGCFLGIKRLGSGADHQPPSSAEVEIRVQLYIYSPFGPSWPVPGWTFTFLESNLPVRCVFFMVKILNQCFSTAGPRPGTGSWHQLFRAARGSPGICHFSFLSIFRE
jgi:hypothetical protein